MFSKPNVPKFIYRNICKRRSLFYISPEQCYSCIRRYSFREKQSKFSIAWDLGVMIICSKFVCSKNLLNTILLLLDTIRANDKKSEKWSTVDTFFVNCSNPVYPSSTGFEQLINFVWSS